ncbi:unnamed protein product [Microthlaspi erraticum]|uniref:F-box protein At3g26010-like beta-propeller domain-containing protein n=1 Tax=Microthlaspi erraticum TaxID=1685480 RepID=A0A6D2KJ87_9BRAS|nr:unnamed protein product [Microthlaspi erraticum]
MKFGEDVHVPESVMVMILVRLPTRAVSRFKSVCFQWKSLLGSRYFRDLYRSVNQRNLFSPWSMMREEPRAKVGMVEYFGERWGLKESPGTCLLRFLDDHTKQRGKAVAITDGLVLIEECDILRPSKFLVGSPVLQQWINIPSPPTLQDRRTPCKTALVTNVNNNGDLLGYKVVKYELGFSASGGFHFQCYSSETGNWTYHQVFRDHIIFKNYNGRDLEPINLNGWLLWHCPGVKLILAYDFYPTTDQEPQQLFRLIDLPDDESFGYKETCSVAVSCGSLVYIRYHTGQFRVWRLKNHKTDPSKEHWELLWNVINDGQELLVIGGISSCFVVTMHPFDSEVVYLEGHGNTHKYLISGNLRTEKFQVLKAYKKNGGQTFWKFVLPQRHDSIPCPPGCSLVSKPEV